MISRWIRAAGLLALAPVAALAFDTVDFLPFPSTGAFPAWSADRLEPWRIFAYAGLMHDDNAFRRSSGEQSDVVARYGFGLRGYQRIVGRQDVFVEGIAEYYDYNRFSEIDHLAYSLRGDWLWELGNQLDGAATYVRRRRHADLGEFQAERKVMITSDRLAFDGAYRFAADWRLSAGADHTRAKREGDDVGAQLEASTVRTGLAYLSPARNAIGVEARATKGNTRISEQLAAAVGASVDNDYDETELAATLAYGLGAQLRVGGRVGRTSRSYEQLPGRDFDGTTYRGRVDWLPANKLVFSFEAYKEPTSIIDIDSTHVVRTGTAFGASWAATFKLVFSARFVNERRVNEGDLLAEVLGLPPRDETMRTWSFGAGWEPQRHWQLGVGLDFGDRSSNELGRDYDYRQVMLNARFTF